MNRTTINTLITAVATIILAVATFSGALVGKWLERTACKKEQQKGLVTISQERRDALNGTSWKGKVFQPDSPNNNKEYTLTINFIIEGDVIKGDGEIFYSSTENDNSKLEFSGGYYDDSYFKLDYRNKDPRIIQYGLTIMKLSEGFNRIEGPFLGHGHRSGKLVQGTLSLVRRL